MTTTSTNAAIDTVTETLQDYATRGQFRSFSRVSIAKGKATFRLRWHLDRTFELVFDSSRDTLRFPNLLPNVPPDSAMYEAFKAFLRSRQSEQLPYHRRIDTEKAQVRPYNRNGRVAISLKVKDGDYEYGTRKLINLAHETYLSFLQDGPYLEYMVEELGLDPDQW